MLRRIGLKGFKAFRDMEPLDLTPITVLAGANSSGKSSIIHSLLLLKQSLESRRPSALVLNGEFLNFASYSEIVFGRRDEKTVTIVLEAASPQLPRSLTKKRLEEFFNQAEVRSIRERQQIDGTYQFTFGVHRQQEREEIYLQNSSISSVLAGMRHRQAELRLEYEGDGYTGTATLPDPGGFTTPYPVESVELKHFLPERCSYREVATLYGSEAGGRSGRKNVPLDLFAIDDLQAWLSERLHYVGPLRSEPQRGYFVLADRVDLDHRGEYAAQVLLSEQKEPVNYLIDGREEQIELLRAVNRVLDLIGMPQSIEPVSREGMISQLMLPLIGDDKTRVTMLDVGFGVSQVLPIIMAGLQADKGDTLIFEQPESHLHPRVQCNLADFFVLLMRLGKQIIVETHSDHLINGLRQQIAADVDDKLQLASKVRVVFVRPPDGEGVGASLEPLEFDEYGLIANWPPEFLPQSMAEAQELLRAAANKRRKASSREER